MSLSKSDFTSTKESLPDNQYSHTHVSPIPPVHGTSAYQGNLSQVALTPAVSRSDLNGLVNNPPLGRSMFTNRNVQKINDPVKNLHSSNPLLNLMQALTDQNNLTSINLVSVNKDETKELLGNNDLSLDE